MGKDLIILYLLVKLTCFSFSFVKFISLFYELTTNCVFPINLLGISIFKAFTYTVLLLSPFFSTSVCLQFVMVGIKPRAFWHALSSTSKSSYILKVAFLGYLFEIFFSTFSVFPIAV